MAKLSRAKSRDEWRKLKSSLEKYGKSSEMFSEVEIKSFGTSPSDPFQIQFSSEGPKTNIVDLGYGTSQVLPILYMIASAPQRGVFLIQQPEVHLHPKAQAALGTHFVEAEIAPNNASEQQHIIFDPVPRVDGIEASADPLFEPRANVYLLTGKRRRAAETT
jgi:hypothetical protein